MWNHTKEYVIPSNMHAHNNQTGWQATCFVTFVTLLKSRHRETTLK